MKIIIAETWQHGLVKYGLDVKDAVILAYMRRLMKADSTHRAWKGKEVYYYVQLDRLLENLPALNLKKRQLLNRIKNYIHIDVLERLDTWIKSTNDFGKYLAPHYRFTPEAFTALFAYIDKGRTRKKAT